MSNGVKFFGSLLLVELLVCGFFYIQKIQAITPPVPNFAVTDSITAADLKTLIEATNSPDDWHWLASIYMATGYFSEAVATFQHASEMMPESAEVAFDYAFCLSRVGDLEESNRQFEKAIELKHPNTLQAMFFIGRNYLQLEDPENAEQAFRKSAKIPLSKFELAKILYRKGQYDESEELLKEVVELEPGTVQSFVLMSQIALKKGDRIDAISKSIEASGKWVRIDSPFGDERGKLIANYGTLGYEKAARDASVMVNQRHHLDARRALIAAQEVEWNPVVQDAYIKMSIFTGRIAEAIELINERIERYGPNSETLLLLGDTLMKNEETEKAIDAWMRGGDINTDQSARECYRNLAAYYRDVVGDQKKSEEFQTKGLILYCYEVLAYEAFEQAVPMTNMATRFSPESAEAQFVKGRTQLGLAKLPEAVAAFQRCLELDPTHGRAMRYLEALGEN